MSSVYYVTGDEIQVYYDNRRLGELLSDTGTPVVAASIALNPVLVEAIAAACGEIDTHCQQGKRYTKADLELIITTATASPDDAVKRRAAGVLRQLAADLTFGTLMARRGYAADTMARLAPRLTVAYDTLEQLYQGRRVFDISTAIEAGRPHRALIGKNSYQPSAFNRLFGIWPDSAGPFGAWPDRW